MYLPLVADMVDYGWGISTFSGTHPVLVTYDPVAFTLSSTVQPWVDSFPDGVGEMGPMTLKVEAGTIDATNKKLTIQWRVGGSAYWGADWVQTAAQATVYTWVSAK
jgi:hypothetical protein